MKRLWDEFWDTAHDFFSGGFGVVIILGSAVTLVMDMFCGPPLDLHDMLPDILILTLIAFIVIALRHKKS